MRAMCWAAVCGCGQMESAVSAVAWSVEATWPLCIYPGGQMPSAALVKCPWRPQNGGEFAA
jgi:hypothetical protein